MEHRYVIAVIVIEFMTQYSYVFGENSSLFLI